MNQRKLKLLQSMKETQWHRNGVAAIDDTLLPKTGWEIPGAEKFWDHNPKLLRLQSEPSY
ncbi:MAG: hypothetical protein QW279_05945 [Candidatus Jordarchaeaceae archaeon]